MRGEGEREREAHTRPSPLPPSPTPFPPPLLLQPTILSRRPSVFGTIIESYGPLPDPASSDAFEGEAWEWVGTAASVAVPALALGAVAVGAFAAKTYDSGADALLLPASGEDRPAQIVETVVVEEEVVSAPPVVDE